MESHAIRTLLAELLAGWLAGWLAGIAREFCFSLCRSRRAERRAWNAGAQLRGGGFGWLLRQEANICQLAQLAGRQVEANN